MFTIPTGFSSTPSDVYIVSSDANAEVKTMELKAVNDGGTTKPVSGFIISPDNVVSVNQNGKVTVFSTFSLAFSGARLSDIGGNPRIIPISTNGEVSFATLPAGVYTLDVIVDDRLAYESIINIGQQPQQQVNQIINTVNQRTTISTSFQCPVNSTLVNGTCVPSPPPINNFTIPLPNGTFPNGTIPTPNGTLPNGTTPTPNGTLPNGTIPIATLNLTEPTPPETNMTEPTPPETNMTEPTPPETNMTEPTPPETNMTEPTPPETNMTEPTPLGGGDGDGDGGPNQTAFSEPQLECPEGEQVAPDGLSCEPIPEECGEGEELVDGQCQPLPTEEDSATDEEISGDEGGGDEGGGDEGGGDEGGGDEGGGDEGGGDEGGGDEGGEESE
jgi:uncharacterized membrane protein YgcG